MFGFMLTEPGNTLRQEGRPNVQPASTQSAVSATSAARQAAAR